MSSGSPGPVDPLAGARGNHTVKVVPMPHSDATVMSPPIARVMDATMARPSPFPRPPGSALAR
jgi:hypothetical protein